MKGISTEKLEMKMDFLRGGTKKTYRFVVNSRRRLAVRVEAGAGQHSRHVGQHLMVVRRR